MLVNEITWQELNKIVIPVLQLKPMSLIVSEIGKILKISQATRNKIQEQDEYILRYKGFEVFFYDLRWLRYRGPCISLQFKRESTRLQQFLNSMFPKNNKLMDIVCGEVIEDLKKICLSQIEEIKFASTYVHAHSYFGNNNVGFRVIYPTGAFNIEWQQGRDIAPVMILNEFHSNKWFISFSFNASCFIRDDDRTVLRKDWKMYTADISKSIDASLLRNHHPNDPHDKTFEEWSEDMILDFGDDIVPSLPEIWSTVKK